MGSRGLDSKFTGWIPLESDQNQKKERKDSMRGSNLYKSKWLQLLVLMSMLLFFGCKDRGIPGGNNESKTTDGKRQTVQLKVRFPIPVYGSGLSPFLLAQDKGYYTEENLDVTFGMGSKALNPVATVVSGQDDIGILGGPDTLLVARSKGYPLKAVAVLHRNSNFPCLLTLKSSGLTNVDQLVEKRVGFFYGHISTDIIRNLFRKQDIIVPDIDCSINCTQFISGHIDAQWAFTVTAAIDLPSKGVAVNVISPADYGIVTHGYTIFVTEEMLTKKADVIQRFLKATFRGVSDVVTEPAAGVDAILKRAPQMGREVVMEKQVAMNKVTSCSELYPMGYMDASMFQETYDRLLEEKVLDKPFDIDTAYTLDILQTIQATRKGDEK